MPGPTLLVGLTGSLASGKSTVLAVFAAEGAATFDADAFARAALAPGSPLLAPVRAALGDEVFHSDGTLNRGRVAQVVFADPAKRRALEAIVHPEVLRREDAAARGAEDSGTEIAVFDVPLLIEVGRAAIYHRLVVAACDEAVQVARAVARGMSEADARARIAAQMPLAEKVGRADYVVDTSGTRSETETRARAVFARLRADAAALRSGRFQPRPGP